MECIIQGKKLIWEFGKNESAASRLIENNLFIEDVWNMKDTVRYTDTCVSVSVLSEDSFCFVTFRGLSFTMRIVGEKVECVSKQITR